MADKEDAHNALEFEPMTLHAYLQRILKADFSLTLTFSICRFDASLVMIFYIYLRIMCMSEFVKVRYRTFGAIFYVCKEKLTQFSIYICIYNVCKVLLTQFSILCMNVYKV